MNAKDESYEFTVALSTAKDIDPNSLRRLTLQLKSELIEFKGVTTDFVRDNNIPNGAMSAEAITLGLIAISVLPTTIPALIGYMKDWMLRTGATIKIRKKSSNGEIEVDIPHSLSKEKLEEFLTLLENHASTDG